MKNYVFILCFFVLLGCKETKENSKKAEISTVETQVNSWVNLESSDGSKPVQRHEAAFVRVGDKFYLLGGRDIRPVSIFDPKLKSWTLGAKPPIEMHHFQPIVFNNKVYIINALTGGWPNETPTTHVYIYNPELDSWEKGDEIPEERRRGSTGNILNDGKIYMACGIKNGHVGDHKNWLDRYDPVTGEWEILENAPRPRDHFQAVVANDKIYALAGRNTGIDPDDGFAGTISEVDVYDINTNSWTTLASEIPTQRAGNMALLYNGKVVVAGGESNKQDKAHSEVEALDLDSNEWVKMPSLIVGRHGTGLLAYEGALYVASGCGNKGGKPELFTSEKYEE
ncbi:galactose oxidase [Aurantibacter crassamenti]|uniref:Kelch repeat-containing protein n=1 Tax=Aurantibacter crassamenti TaxID=1837375 RepID=UPI001939A6B3|nr:kelch repeat-containing protein [Aurantibacter crassamenti]MBM1105105.1 galactose oxidase [Aurantibacter crassamenti]